MESRGNLTSSSPLQLQNVVNAESLSPSPHQLPSVMNPNSKITPSFFDGTNYKEWAYSPIMLQWLFEEYKGWVILMVVYPNQTKRTLNIHIGNQKIC